MLSQQMRTYFKNPLTRNVRRYVVLFGFFFHILLFFFQIQIKDEMSKQMEKTLVNNYGVNTNTNKDNKADTDVWNDIQKNVRGMFVVFS